MIDWTDRRPIDTMPFGSDTPETSRTETVTIVRGILTACGCTVADDITKLGCTGLAAHVEKVVAYLATLPVLPVPFATDQNELATAWGRFLRLGLAGGGVGLPCFVPPDRYCLIHDTIGGLQDGQEQHHAEFVGDVSRELTPAERAKTAMVESARRVKGADAASELLTGWKRGEAVKAVKERLEEEGVGEPPASAAEEAEDGSRSDTAIRRMLGGAVGMPAATPAWKCPEHPTTNWRCRYCVAQAVVEGPLEPVYVLDGDDDGDITVNLDAAQMERKLIVHDEECDARVTLYARVARFTRKLSRD